jgi:DNA-binding transcriptional LysR family regulator
MSPLPPLPPLPPLNALIAFETAVRHMSFTRAAVELNLSQSAVSRQVFNFKQFLGQHIIGRQVDSVCLVRATDHWANNGGKYCLITPEERRENAALRRFKQWLLLAIQNRAAAF